jgi:hypothetical protein
LEPPERWSSYTVSDRNGIGPTTDRALELVPDWANGIEKAALLYALVEGAIRPEALLGRSRLDSG